jgi:hypothetical protein
VRELKAQGMRPTDIAKTMGIGRTSVYRVPRMFFAHSTDRKDRSDWQTLPDHLTVVAALAAQRGSKFGSP